MKVVIKAKTDLPVNQLASHAARVCYSMNAETLNEPIDVKARLFEPGHHTTLQHNYFSFFVEDIPVSSVVFGLHLVSPFYNSDQRSGRYSKMYNSPDFDSLQADLATFYPDAPSNQIMTWVKKGIEIYNANIARLTELAADVIQKERPFASEKYITQNAPKFAQEQLRVFISQIAPTALDFTVNLSALTALYRAAWSSEMRQITQKMADLVISEAPEIAYMFNPEKRMTHWAPTFLSHEAQAAFQPSVDILNVFGDESQLNMVSLPDSLDTLYFMPETMTNTQFLVQTKVTCSCATFGQDQRHRTIKRTVPSFTGAFYIPPLVAEGGLTETACAFMQEWLDLEKVAGSAVATLVAPYGAMVTYQKTGDMNALVHEQAKRTCWCAQEEIFALASEMRSGLQKKMNAAFTCFAPPCVTTGVCQEGVRYCGRNLKENVFLKRKI